jgi:hypothetical protein
LTESIKEGGVYENYSWVKDKLLSSFYELKDNSIQGRVADRIGPVREQILEKTSKISNSFEYLKKEICALKNEVPSLSELKAIEITSFFKEKCKSFF